MNLPQLRYYIYGTGDVGLPDYGGYQNAGGTFRFLAQCFDQAEAKANLISKLFLVKGSIGMTTKLNHLEDYIHSAKICLPLKPGLANLIHQLQHGW